MVLNCDVHFHSKGFYSDQNLFWLIQKKMYSAILGSKKKNHMGSLKRNYSDVYNVVYNQRIIQVFWRNPGRSNVA